MHKRTIYNSFGQSLFEVVVAIGVAALILVAAVSLSTTNIRNASFSKNNALATKYAQEGAEYLRQIRDEGWSNFITNYTGAGTKNLGNSFSSGTPVIDSVFSRQYTTICKLDTGSVVGCAVGNNPALVDILVVVSWTDGQGTHNVNNATTLSNWQI